MGTIDLQSFSEGELIPEIKRGALNFLPRLKYIILIEKRNGGRIT